MLNKMSPYRQLAAIMFTDIVGYIALMGEDDQKAFDLLNRNRLIAYDSSYIIPSILFTKK